MIASKDLLLVRLAREFHDLPETVVVEVVSTLTLLDTGTDGFLLEEEARGLLIKIRLSTRRRGAFDEPAVCRRETGRNPLVP